MATYHVSPIGNDTTGDGSEGNPWATINKASQGVASLGDTIKVATGIYQLSTRIKIDPLIGDGTPLIIERDGDEGEVEIQIQSGATVCVWANDAKKSTWRNIVFSNPLNLAKQFMWVGNASTTRFENCHVEWGTGDDRLFTTIAPTTTASRATLQLINTPIEHAAPSSAKGHFYFSRAEYPVTLTLYEVSAIDWVSGNYCIFSSQQLTLDTQDCIFDGNYAVFSAGSTPNIESFTFKRNKIIFDSINSGGGFCDFVDELGDFIASNSELFDVENNIVWASDDASGSIDADNLNFSTAFGLPERAFWMVNPSGANAARIVSGDNPRVSLVRTLCGVGDSILAGASATTGNNWWDVFNSGSGLSIVADNWTSVGGSRISGAILEVDRCMANHSPKFILLLCGANNIGTAVTDRKPSNTITPRQYADEFIKLIDRVVIYGAIPLVVGCPSVVDPDVTGAEAQSIMRDMNDLISVYCVENGILFISVYASFVNTGSDWSTSLYTDILTDVHPNDAGHAVIGQLAVDLYNQYHAIQQRGLDSALGICRPVIWPPRAEELS